MMINKPQSKLKYRHTGLQRKSGKCQKSFNVENGLCEGNLMKNEQATDKYLPFAQVIHINSDSKNSYQLSIWC